MIDNTDNPDFLFTAHRRVKQAQLLGAAFHPDGTWTLEADRAPLPPGLADRLRVHRGAIIALIKEGQIEGPTLVVRC